MVISIYVPTGYHLLEERTQSWVRIEDLKDKHGCWDGSTFTDIDIATTTNRDGPDMYANIDAVTTIGINSKDVASVSINYHWKPPWIICKPTHISFHPPIGCTVLLHCYRAIQDFVPCHTYRTDLNLLECRLPVRRFEKLRALNYIPNLDRQISHNSRYISFVIPKVGVHHLCESCAVQTQREHALVYLKTVLAVKAVQQNRKSGDSHIEIKDKGLRLSTSAFRRLRRLMSMCAVPNRYIAKIHRMRDGKKHLKRRVLLKLGPRGMASCTGVKENVRDNADFYHRMQCPPSSKQHASLYKIQEDIKTQWYRIDMKTTNSIAMEGVLITIND